nr:MAG TPA: hypothetical protein [Caudoviricetes sp.]
MYKHDYILVIVCVLKAEPTFSTSIQIVVKNRCNSEIGEYCFIFWEGLMTFEDITYESGYG